MTPYADTKGDEGRSLALRCVAYWLLILPESLIMDKY